MALADNLVSYWSLDEASGNALDAAGANALTDTNTVGAGAGVVSGARVFAVGSSQQFTHADNADLSIGAVDCSFSVWVKLASKSGNRPIITKEGGPGIEYDLHYDSGIDRFQWRACTGSGFAGYKEANANTFGSPSTGVWYFLTVWHDSVNGVLGIAVNAGTADTTTGFTGGIWDGANSFRLGGFSAGPYFDGSIDEAGFWKRVLTSAERTDLYNSGSGRSYSYISGGSPPTPHTLASLGVGG